MRRGARTYVVADIARMAGRPLQEQRDGDGRREEELRRMGGSGGAAARRELLAAAVHHRAVRGRHAGSLRVLVGVLPTAEQNTQA